MDSAIVNVDSQDGSSAQLATWRTKIQNPMDIRKDFPPGFMFGSATSSFQIEGAVDVDGRGKSIWDTFCEKKQLRGWEDASYHYYKYKEDVAIMKEMGLDCYRFSISWPRVLPLGRRGTNDANVNHLGVKFYNNLIDELIANDIEPMVTLFHWDLPQALEDEYGGFLCATPPDGSLAQIVLDFGEYAEFCYQTFGRKVKYWITLNEPYTVCLNGYGTGTHAPGRCTPNYSIEKVSRAVGTTRYFKPDLAPQADLSRLNAYRPAGNSGTEPYIVAHNMILAHGQAYHLYQKYKRFQKGQIGMAHCIAWGLPNSDSPADHIAAERYVDFWFAWFMDPVTVGDYPACMKELVGDRLPPFTDSEKKLIVGTYDYIGVNYYTTLYVTHDPIPSNDPKNVATDIQVATSYYRDGVPIGRRGGSSWLYMYRQGLEDALRYVQRKYNNPEIIITENGIDEKMEFESMSLWEALTDDMRLDYYHIHLNALKQSINKWGVKLKGWCLWSFIDNFEWSQEFTVRFGTVYCDYKNGFARHKKASAEWLKLALADREFIPIKPLVPVLPITPLPAALESDTTTDREKKRARAE